jgi:hypothetical protein
MLHITSKTPDKKGGLRKLLSTVDGKELLALAGVTEPKGGDKIALTVYGSGSKIEGQVRSNGPQGGYKVALYPVPFDNVPWEVEKQDGKLVVRALISIPVEPWKLRENGIAPNAPDTFTPSHMVGDRVTKHKEAKMKREFTLSLENSGYSRFGYEVPDGNGGRIDVGAYLGQDLHLFELKIKSTARKCVDDAMGQLLTYWYNTGRIATKLVVIGPIPTDVSAEEYLSVMRALGVPVFYQQFTYAETAAAGGV